MAGAAVITPDLRKVVRDALAAFTADSSYCAEMITAARELERREVERKPRPVR
jgi:hypothetical protein